MTHTRPPTPSPSSPADGAQSAQSGDSAVTGSGGAADSTGRVVLDDTRIRRALMRIAHEIVESTPDLGLLYLVAIPNGGAPLARRLAENLESLSGARPQLGILDTTLYRDDLSTRGTRPQLRRRSLIHI